MIKQADKLLAEGLVKKGFLSQPAVDKYLQEIQSSGEMLRHFLIRHGYLQEKQILDVLAAAYQLSVIDLRQVTIEKNVIDKIPVRLASYYKILPVKVAGKTMTLASSTPLDVKLHDEIRMHLGMDLQVVLAKEADVLDAMNKYYGLAADTIERLSKDAKKTVPEGDASRWVEDLEQGADEASVANLVNQILLEAYKKRATDIHIEPYRHKVRVRYRIDGVLIDANVPPAVKNFLPSIISRIKLMANLSIVEKRLPQDGSAIVKTKEQDLDLRVSTIPAPRGESMVIRILPTNVTLLNLENLVGDVVKLKIFRSLIEKPHGIILVTGPTGSGKTTTLYACLHEINTQDLKIITIEDPIEYEMEGVTQIQVNPKVNLDFATGLRSVLRHDPDVIMVGEIRDMETAEIAIRTALTGHLVFSTLHTNDAASAVTRLVEMGLEPYLVASSVEAFVAQRLVRLICPKCKEEVKTPLLEIKEEMAQILKLRSPDQIKIFQGRGCEACNQTGYYGRAAIYEILVVSDPIRQAILEKRSADHLKKIAMKNGMVTLRQDGFKKVLEGLTTPMEVLNQTVKDEVGPEPEKNPAPTPAPLVMADPAAPLRVLKPEVLTAKNDYDSRVYSRLKEKIPIRYSIVRPDANDAGRFVTDKVEHSSITKDISAGGLRFVSGYTLPVGTVLELKIQLDKNERSIDCLAKVCRVEDDNLSAMFNLVVYYLDIAGAERVKIDNFVKSNLKVSDLTPDNS